MRNKIRLATLIVIIAILLSVFFAKNKATDTDPRSTLLVTEALLTHHTIKLDYYGDEILNKYGYTIHKKNNHYYNFFPLGTPLASLPFVFIAKFFGLEMIHSESMVQTAITAVTSVLTFLLLLKLALIFLAPVYALTVATVFWFGSSFASTSGTALWSHNFAVLFALIAIYWSIKATKLNSSQMTWPLISIALFAAYLCRPTMALLIPAVIIYMFSYHRISAYKAGLFLLVLICGFVGFSLYEFRQILPDYYLPSRLSGGSFWEAIYGNLLSPARGILIYSPFILFSLICSKYSKKDWGLKPSWQLIAIAWPISHLILISTFPHWWAGYSFGSRLMVDALPGLFLLTLYSWPTNVKTKGAIACLLLLTLSCMFSILVNSVQGLFNINTKYWNSDPNVDTYPEYLFDWSYPQFLASEAGHEGRLIKYAKNKLLKISPGEELVHDTDRIVFLSWSAPEVDFRWTSSKISSLVFVVNTSNDKFKGELTLRIGLLGKQQVIITLNETQIYSEELDSWNVTKIIHFSPALIKNGKNTIVFTLPNAHQPGDGDTRELALALKKFSIR